MEISGILPVRKSENIVRLGEIMTPLLPATNLQQEWGSGEILIKDEGRLPTGSFKARGLALAVAMAKELESNEWQCLPMGTPELL